MTCVLDFTPLAAVAVIFAVPLETPVTKPFAPTVATAVLSLDHVTDCEASLGVTVAVSCVVLPASTLWVPVMVTPVAGVVAATVIVTFSVVHPDQRLLEEFLL